MSDETADTRLARATDDMSTDLVPVSVARREVTEPEPTTTSAQVVHTMPPAFHLRHQVPHLRRQQCSVVVAEKLP